MQERTISEHNREIIEKRKIARINELLSKGNLTPAESTELLNLQGLLESTIRISKDATKLYFEPLTSLIEKIKDKIR